MGLNVRFAPRWGRLQTRTLYALVDGRREAGTHAIAAIAGIASLQNGKSTVGAVQLASPLVRG